MNRGHETPDHQNGKALLAALFACLGLQILFEHLLSDVFGWKTVRRRLRMLSGQYDRHPRTVLPNVLRDFRNGCDAIVILAPNEPLRAAYRRKLKRHCPRSVWTRVAIITTDGCQAVLQRRSPASTAATQTQKGATP